MTSRLFSIIRTIVLDCSHDTDDSVCMTTTQQTAAQSFRNQNRVLINPDHLGEAATEEQTRALIAALQDLGWSVGHGDNGRWQLSGSERAEFEADFENALRSI